MTSQPKSVTIYVKPGHARAARLAEELREWLQARGHVAELGSGTKGNAAPAAAVAPDLAIALGGDGTILHVARRMAQMQTPVLAIHLGTLGFLAETAVDDLYAGLEAVLAGGGVCERRVLLHAELERDGAIAARYDALNEIVVSKGALARLIQVEVGINGERVGVYRADGLMVATPTGSTGYSFSAGGPVLHPGLEAVVVTPICPHSLSQRPLVVSDRASIAITLKSAPDPTYLTVDGQQGQALAAGDRVHCRRSALTLTLVTAGERNFYHNLRTKLHWG